jgi:uncharacterized protein
MARRRWFFARIQGRRRIGKTTLIQKALATLPNRILYLQIPDSAPAGVLSSVADAFETFHVPEEVAIPPKTLAAFARVVERLVRAGYIVVLDEFQYFTRKTLSEFPSHLQAAVDRLAQDATAVTGGLLVLGSIHAEMSMLLEEKSAPLYNRVTDSFDLGHLDIASVSEILRTHADDDPERLLFLWNIFEGVPKFYRDCFEQGVIAANRADLIETMFFRSSSPLRSEADNWFLHELRGRYDAVLKFVARHPGCSNGDLESHVGQLSAESSEQVGGYLKILRERYGMIERRLPIFSKANSKKGRFYVRDNFLRAWLHAFKGAVDAVHFRPLPELIAQVDERLMEAEGHSLEMLAAALYAERSRKGMSGFRLSSRIEGYWDKADTELDLVALDEASRTIRIANCKRSPTKLCASLGVYDQHIERFLVAMRGRFGNWRVERVGISSVLNDHHRKALVSAGYIAQDLRDLLEGL